MLKYELTERSGGRVVVLYEAIYMAVDLAANTASILHVNKPHQTLAKQTLDEV